MTGAFHGLIGRSLGHSWSVPIHRSLGCADYELFEREPDELAAFLEDPRLGGINVTIPYKQAVMPWCDVIDPAAAAIGAVNTLVRRSDGRLFAWNTDLTGFQYMARLAGISLTDRKVLILGSGGASLTVRQAAREAGARECLVVSRSGPVTYGDLPKHSDAGILINTTPVGMYPHNGESPVDLSNFPQCRGVLDLIYNPRRTRLLFQAKARGIPWSDGLPMLVAQAVAAEEHFFDRPIPATETERILKKLRRDMTNLVLIGMPGSGKSTVGQLLADLSGREAIETDREIVRRAGRSIPEIFATQGEAAFRAMEREEIRRAGQGSGRIIITGGGVVKDPANYEALAQNGWICHLERALELLPTAGRPISQSTDLAELYAQRQPLYEAFRDAAVDNHGDPAAAAARIWREFNAHSGD